MVAFTPDLNVLSFQKKLNWQIRNLYCCNRNLTLYYEFLCAQNQQTILCVLILRREQAFHFSSRKTRFIGAWSLTDGTECWELYCWQQLLRTLIKQSIVQITVRARSGKWFLLPETTNNQWTFLNVVGVIDVIASMCEPSKGWTSVLYQLVKEMLRHHRLCRKGRTCSPLGMSNSKHLDSQRLFEDNRTQSLARTWKGH